MNFGSLSLLRRGSPPALRPRLAILPVLLLLLLYGAACGFVRFATSPAQETITREFIDEQGCHWPNARWLHAKWPALDLSRDSFSAIAPGYHYFLATLSQPFPSELGTFRLFNFLISAGLVTTVWWISFRQSSAPTHSLWLCLPLMLSPPVVKSGCWLVTENAALWATAIALGAMMDGRRPARMLPIAGLAVWAAIWSRQIYAALALPFVSAIFLQLRGDHELCSGTTTASPTPAGGLRRGILLLSFSLAPAAVLLLLQSWGGLVPPNWQSAHHGWSTVPVSFAFAMVGLFSPFFLVAFRWPRLDFGWSDWLVPALAISTALAGPSAYNLAEGRSGGYFWALCRMGPEVFDRSLILAASAGLGAWTAQKIIRLLCRTDHSREAWILAAAFLSWAGAGTLNRMVFQRYFEPTVLLVLILATSLLLPQTRPSHRRLAASFLPLICGQLAILVTSLHPDWIGTWVLALKG